MGNLAKKALTITQKQLPRWVIETARIKEDDQRQKQNGGIKKQGRIPEIWHVATLTRIIREKEDESRDGQIPWRFRQSKTITRISQKTINEPKKQPVLRLNPKPQPPHQPSPLQHPKPIHFGSNEKTAAATLPQSWSYLTHIFSSWSVTLFLNNK